MSLLNSTLKSAVVRLRDMSGNVSHQKVHNRIFDAYEAKSLVFEALNADQQRVLEQYKGGSIPARHPIGQPALLENWADFEAIHQEANLYQLLPRRAKTNQSYLCMRGICQSKGAPFTMDSRVDPIDYKLTFKAADQELKNAFNAKNSEKIANNTIWFDGIMHTPKKACGFVMCYHSVTPAHVNNVVAMVDFMREFSAQPADGDRHRQLKECYKALFVDKHHVFLGTNTAPSREVLNFAKSKGAFIYAKNKLGAYQYCA